MRRTDRHGTPEQGHRLRLAVLHPAGINDRTTGAEFAAKGFCQCLNDRDVVFFADAATGGDDDFGFAEVDVFLFGRFIADKFEGAFSFCGQFLYCR